MEQSTFENLQKNKGIEFVPPATDPVTTPTKPAETLAEQFPSIMAMLRVVKKPVSTAPTNVPKNFVEQFVIYENAGTYRLYVYVNQTWRYTALT